MAAIAAICSMLAVSAQAQELLPQFRSDLNHLADGRAYASRVPGTAGHEASRAWVARQIRALEASGVKIWTQRFPVVVPRYEKATLEVKEAGALQGSHEIFPFWPLLQRLCTTPAEGIRGKIIYVGDGHPRRLPGGLLTGQIVAVEMNCGGDWQQSFTQGASAVLLLGHPKESWADAKTHLPPLPANLPRFYIPDESRLAAAIREGQDLGQVRLQADGRWDVIEAENIYALVTPPGPRPPQPAVVLAAPLDASCVVPGLGTGADAAMDLSLLLNLLRDYSRVPPARPVLFAFVDAWSLDHRGLREMLMTFGTRKRRFGEWDGDDGKSYGAVRARDRELLQEYQQLRDFAATIESYEQLKSAKVRGDARFHALESAVEDEVALQVVHFQTMMQPLRLRRHRTDDDEEEERLDQEIRRIALRRTRFQNAQIFLLDPNKKLSQVAEKEVEPLRQAARRVWELTQRRINSQCKALEELVARDDARWQLRLDVARALRGPLTEWRPISFVMALDLSDSGPAVGPVLYDHYLGRSQVVVAEAFTTWLQQVQNEDRNTEAASEAERLLPPELRQAVNFAPLKKLDSERCHVLSPVPCLTGPVESFGLGSVTLATLDADHARVDTPSDVVSLRRNLPDWKALLPQVAATRVLLQSLFSGDRFYPNLTKEPSWSRVRGVVVDQAPGEPIPRLPVERFLVHLMPWEPEQDKNRWMNTQHWTHTPIGLRRESMALTRADGRFVIDAMPGWVEEKLQKRYVQGFSVGPDGALTRAVNLRASRASSGVRVQVAIGRANPDEFRVVPFNCGEVTVTDCRDPRFLMNLPKATLRDAIRGSRPQTYNYWLQGSLFVGFFEPGTRWQLIMRAGASRNRLALLHLAPDEPLNAQAHGQPLDEPLELAPAHRAAKDLFELDHRRLNSYERAGITSPAIMELHERTGALLKETEEALEAEARSGQADGGRVFAKSTAALANEIRVYQAVRNMADDVIRAAIFLLLMLAPFAYAMERLLVGTPHIYRQIGGMAAIFALMTALLWSFHPAFRITGQPLMIVMAFAIILMSITVISVVYSRFETGLEEVRSGRAESSAAQTSRGGVLSSAVRLGIANMRKRKLRTFLTATTVVLITFVLLAFTSTSTYQGQSELPVPVEEGAPYRGVMLKQPGGTFLPSPIHTYLETVLAADAVIAPRTWWVDKRNANWRIHLRHPTTGKQVGASAAMGLVAEEDKVSGIGSLLPDWDQFVRDGGCYIGESFASRLGVNPGDTVLVAGRPLKLVGTIDTMTLSNWRDLDGSSPLPYDYDQMSEDERKRQSQMSLASVAAQMESGMGAEGGAELQRLAGDRVVFVPKTFVEGRDDYKLYSIAVHAPSFAAAKEQAQSLAQRLSVPIYYGGDEKVRVLSATVLLPQGPKGLLVPLIIGGLIIFNTMLGSIAERRGEIHVYTSLGLAPLHVGVLFLAEAVTYGLMGTVFGYIAGQGVASALSSLGLLGGITLNYSGTQAIMTMVLVMVVVVLSSLVPAYLAGRLAVPSESMRWAVPEPKDDTITDTLPFTVTGRTAPGVLMFLQEYFDAHREGSIGNFSTDALRLFHIRTGDYEALGLACTIWLAPYDLGVRQQLTLNVRATEDEDVLELDLMLHRGSGQENHWWRLNHVFLGDLRRQLLGWRNLSPERMLDYIARGEAVRAELARTPAEEEKEEAVAALNP